MLQWNVLLKHRLTGWSTESARSINKDTPNHNWIPMFYFFYNTVLFFLEVLCAWGSLEIIYLVSAGAKKKKRKISPQKIPPNPRTVAFVDFISLNLFKKEVLHYTTLCFTLCIKCTVLWKVNPNQSIYFFLLCWKSPIIVKWWCCKFKLHFMEVDAGRKWHDLLCSL